MDQDIKDKIDAQDAKLNLILKSVEKTRKYFVWIFWITIIAVVLPIIGLAFAIPSFLDTYVKTLGSF